MKKLTPFILIVVPFLLSACFQQHSQEECAGREKEVMTLYKDYIESSYSLFYSEKVDSCIVAYTGVAGQAKPGELVPIKNYIMDFSNKKILLETNNVEDWQNKVREMRGDVSKPRDEKPAPTPEKSPEQKKCEELSPSIKEALAKKTEKDGNARELKEIFYSPKDTTCYYTETTFTGKKDTNGQQSFGILLYKQDPETPVKDVSCAFDYSKTAWKEKEEGQCTEFNKLVADLKAKA